VECADGLAFAPLRFALHSGVFDPEEAAISRPAQPSYSEDAVPDLVGSMPGTGDKMKRAKSIFDEGGSLAARKAVCERSVCSWFVLFLLLVGAVLQTNAVGLGLNFRVVSHIEIALHSGVFDPEEAAISRPAQPSYSEDAVPSLGA
jgi:hypothetical protein